MVGFIVDLSWFFRHFLHPPVGATSAVLAFVLSWAKKSASGADMHGAQWSRGTNRAETHMMFMFCSDSVQHIVFFHVSVLYILCFYTFKFVFILIVLSLHRSSHWRHDPVAEAWCFCHRHLLRTPQSLQLRPGTRGPTPKLTETHRNRWSPIVLRG